MRDPRFEVPDKKENPRYKINCLSFLTLWFTFKVFKLGWRRDFTEEDLTKPLPDHKAKELGDRTTRYWLEEVDRAKKHKTNPKLARVFMRLFGKEFMFMALILCIMEFAVRSYQPMFIGLLIRYFLQDKGIDNTKSEGAEEYTYFERVIFYWRPHVTKISTNEAIVYATCVVLCSFIAISVIHPYMLSIQHIGMKMKIASCSLMYRKALQLNIEEIGGGTTGFVVNLMSNDVNRFDMVPLYLHYVWIAPCQYLLVLYFLYCEVGKSAFVGCSAVFLMLPIQVLLGVNIAKLREKIAKKTDKRVRQMNEIISGIAVIKMYAWENAFSKMINQSRKEEINQLRHTVYIRGCIMSFIMFTTRSAIFLTVLYTVMGGRNITAEVVFFVTSFYQIVRQTMTVYLPQALGYLAEAVIALRRIENFMHTNETTIVNSSPMNPSVIPTDYKVSTSAIIKATNVYVQYGSTICLRNINFESRPGQLTVLIGPVASGKSCMMNLVLQELVPMSGSFQVIGRKSYASQEPWLFEGTVRQNILFGQPYDKERYMEVTKVCALLKDFQLLPYGDKTIVGERGVSLSGGQRARINLARCVYKKADIYLLDDPLSAVDTYVGKVLFEQCIVGYLKTKIVILATHQLQYLNTVEQILVLENGDIVDKGNFQQLKQRGKGYARLLGETMMTSAIEQQEKIRRSRERRSFESGVSYSGISKGGATLEKPFIVAEMRTQGTVSTKVYKNYFRAGGNWFTICFVFLMFFITQIGASASDYLTTVWVLYEEHLIRYNSMFTSHFLYPILTSKTCIIVCGSLILAIIVMSLARAFIFFTFCMNASVNLHDGMFKSVSTARMSFFYSNASGRLLNRFSKDLGAVDEFLPCSMIDTFQIGLNLIGVVLVLGVVNYMLLIPAFFITIMFYFLRIYYIRSSTSIKRIEGVTRSPVFSHFNATMNGLTTIRSHGQENLISDEFDTYQDINSSAYYLFMSTSRAFGYWLDLLCVLFITTTTFSFFISQNVEGAYVGLCITQCIGLTSLFQWGMRQSAEMENQMTSVERVLEFFDIEHEAAMISSPENKPPPGWPSQGKIEFKNTILRYSAQGEAVLRNLSLTVESKEKIGIVGRTGAGKSSLMNCLFRMSEFQGAILIDGVNISRLGLHDLRSKISIIPQEPLIFSGTLRYNVDPFKVFTDMQIFTVLVDVEFRSALIIGMDCLKETLTDGGANLSMGQRQLVCLARAILYNNKILIMDEATANMDPQTDKFIQNTIHTKFAHCTVMTIAHRLHTVMKSDRVLVLDAGEIKEIAHPHILLQNKNGMFTRMVEQTGESMANYLRQMAREHYTSKR